MNSERGASITEVLLTIALVAMVSPFLYNQVARTSTEIRDINTARGIADTSGAVMNFVRMHGDEWPGVAQIELTETELAGITDAAVSGFIDRYEIGGAIETDVYLAFDLGDDALRNTKIAKHIGGDAGMVGPDGVAYGDRWAAAAPDWSAGNLVLRVAYNASDDDQSKYLHREAAGDAGLNIMGRDLNMGRFDVYDAGTVSGDSATATGAGAAFVNTEELAAGAVYFTRGANLDGGGMQLGSLRVTGDVTGFRNITALSLNGSGFSAAGNAVADRAMVSNSVNVGTRMTMKSDAVRTISGFTVINAHSLATPFLSAGELMFFNGFGLTVSGELLMSTDSPIRIGDWIFPSTRPPSFSRLTLSRAQFTAAPSAREFEKLYKQGWSQ